MVRNPNDIPMLGLFGIVSHRIHNIAKGMYKEFDMSRGQADILFELKLSSSMSQKEMASRLNVSAPSITSSIQKLEREGYINRIPDKMDQRIMRLSLTEKGLSCVQSVQEVSARMDDIVFRKMNQEERLLFRRLLLQINENLDGYEMEHGGESADRRCGL